MINNPEFLRNVRLQVTPRRTLFASGLTLFLILVGYFLTWIGTEPSPYVQENYNHFQEFGSSSFALLLFGQFVLLHIIATSLVGGSVIQERVRGTLIFQQMSLLSPHEMLLGKLFGSSAMCYVLAALTMPFALFSASAARISPITLFWIYTLLFVGAICLQAVGLFFSAAITNGTENSSRNLMGFCYSVGAVGGIISLIIFANIVERDWQITKHDIYFFGLPFPSPMILVGLMLFIGFWAYVGAVRAFKELQLIRLSPKPIWLFFASLETLLVGLFWGGIARGVNDYDDYYKNYLYSQGIALIISYLTINWMALMGLAGVTTINRNQLREWWSATGDAFSMLRRNEIRQALVAYPIAIAISLVGLAALWISLNLRLDFLGATTDNRFSVEHLVLVSAFFVLTMTAMAAFIQFWAMFRFRIAAQAGIALWILFLVIAGISAAVMGERSIPALLNPLIATSLILDKPSDMFIAISGLVIQIGFAAICILMAVWKWRRTRAEMLKA